MSDPVSLGAPPRRAGAGFVLALAARDPVLSTMHALFGVLLGIAVARGLASERAPLRHALRGAETVGVLHARTPMPQRQLVVRVGWTDASGVRHRDQALVRHPTPELATAREGDPVRVRYVPGDPRRTDYGEAGSPTEHLPALGALLFALVLAVRARELLRYARLLREGEAVTLARDPAAGSSREVTWRGRRADGDEVRLTASAPRPVPETLRALVGRDGRPVAPSLTALPAAVPTPDGSLGPGPVDRRTSALHLVGALAPWVAAGLALRAGR